MPRHVLKDLKIEEISFVDNPAQEHARMTIMKSAAPVPPPAKSDGEKAQERLSALAMAEHQRTGVPFSQALNAVLQGAEGKRLYQIIYGGRGTSMSKIANIEIAMESQAEHYAEKNGIDKAAAFVKLMQTDDDFRDLVVKHREARRNPAEMKKQAAYLFDEARDKRKVLAKAFAATAEGKLEKLARAYAEDTGKSYEQAYSAVLDTPEGRQLYRGMRDEA